MTEYIEDVGLTEALRIVLDNPTFGELAPLRENNVRILPLMKVKTNKEGEHQPSSGYPAVLKKVPDLMKAAGVNSDFILVMDYYEWNHPKGINPQASQEAYIHHALMSVEVEKVEDKAGQEVLKTANRNPDVVEYTQTVVRYPGYNEDQVEFSRTLLRGAEAAKQLASGSLDPEEPPRIEPAEALAPEGEPSDEPEPTVRRRGRSK